MAFMFQKVNKASPTLSSPESLIMIRTHTCALNARKQLHKVQSFKFMQMHIRAHARTHLRG